jgi:hypothetical protein
MQRRWVLIAPFTSDEWPHGTSAEVQSAEEALVKAEAASAAAFKEIRKARSGWENARLAAESARVQLARLRGDEYAVQLSDVTASDTGAPMPWIVADDGGVTIMYLASEPPLKDPHRPDEIAQQLEVNAPQLFGLLRFRRGARVHFSGPNDEALQMHRLYGCGLHHYSAHEVFNSRWAAVTWNRNAKVGDALPVAHRPRHFVVTFHDSMVEVLASSYTCDAVRGTWDEVRHLAIGSLPAAPVRIRPDLVGRSPCGP